MVEVKSLPRRIDRGRRPLEHEPMLEVDTHIVARRAGIPTGGMQEDRAR
jgi:hypothetical protein